jgi:hypothetical protein
MRERSLLWAAVVMAAAALLAVVVLALDRQDGSASHNVVTGTPGTRLSQPQPQPQERPAQPMAAAPLPPDEALFWRLIEETRRAGDNDTARQHQLLKDRLTELSPQAIVQFERTRDQFDVLAYTWRMWGAAATIEDGCSDDCFRDFRAYVISLGRGAYERAVRNPDSLATVARDAESGDWENADDVAPDAYASVTGNDFPLDDTDLAGAPAGARLSFDEAALRRRYPRLAARFRSF